MNLSNDVYTFFLVCVCHIIFLLAMDDHLVSSCITLGEFNKFQDYIISEINEIQTLVESIENLCTDDNRDQECDTDEILQFDENALSKIKLALKLSEIVFILLELYGQVLEEYWALSYYETMFAYPINIENEIACHGILKNRSDIFHIGYHINAVCHNPLSLEVSE